MFDAININIYPGQCVFCETCSMSNGLHESSFLMHKNIFLSKNITKRIVHNIDPYILWQVILMKANDTIFLKIAIFFSIAESIATMSSFHWTVISMSIEIDAIDLC